MKKIVVLDGYGLNPGDLSWEGMERQGDLVVYDRTPEDKVLERMQGAAYVMTNKTPVSREVIEQCPDLEFIGSLATGYNQIDVKAARDNDIPVSNVPNYSTDSVAQHVFALILETAIHVGHHSDAVFEGRWASNPDFVFWDYPLVELAGKTLGVVGYGNTGSATAKIAKAFGMNVLAVVRTPRGDHDDVAKFVDMDTMLAEADIISLHVPLFPSTENLINKDTIAKMKDGVVVINTSRGLVVNEADMAQALKDGKVKYFAADVVSVEPIEEDNPLLDAPNCILTPHIAWATIEARTRCMDIATENLAAFIKGEPRNVVN